MNKTIRTIALIAVLGTMTVGCQKEQEIEPQSSVTEIGTVYTVQYAVDGVLHLETLIGEQAWSDFLHRMEGFGDGTTAFVEKGVYCLESFENLLYTEIPVDNMVFEDGIFVEI